MRRAASPFNAARYSIGNVMMKCFWGRRLDERWDLDEPMTRQADNNLRSGVKRAERVRLNFGGLRLVQTRRAPDLSSSESSAA